MNREQWIERVKKMPPEQRELFIKKLRETSRQMPKVQQVSITRQPQSEVLVLSFAEERMWFLSCLHPESPAYKITAMIRLRGPLQAAILEQCLNEIVRRHENLRAAFVTKNGRPVKRIAPTVSISMQIIDLSGLDGQACEATLQHLAVDETNRRFDLAVPPLLRIVLIKEGGENYSLLICMHHIISDGWSYGILMKELIVLYNAYQAGMHSPLPELSIQYTDFAHWQRKKLQGDVFSAHLDYWKGVLEQHTSLNLPCDYPRRPNSSFSSMTHTFCLPEPLLISLKTLCREKRVTLFMVLLAAFQTLLYRYTGQEIIIVGSPLANRATRETEDLIGCFMNVVPLCAKLSRQIRFSELLLQARDTLQNAYQYQDFPFESLLQDLHIQREGTRNALFQVMLILQNTPADLPVSPGFEIKPPTFDSHVAELDLTISLWESSEGLNGWFEYDANLFTPLRIQKMQQQFQMLLESVCTDTEQRICFLPMLTERERLQLLEWQQKTYPFPLKSIVTRFEAWAEDMSEEVALLFPKVNGDEQITYGMLNKRANQIAHYLKMHGISPGTFVGICLERSIALIYCVIGVLKAGGAYVPLDPDWPQERLSWIWREARPSIILTSEASAEKCQGYPGHLLSIDQDGSILQQRVDNPTDVITLDHLAYLIYTSGSTGRPKAVMISHRSLSYISAAWIDEYNLLDLNNARHLQMAHFSFDVFMGDLVRALCTGTTLVICPQDLLLVPDKLYTLMCEKNIDIAEFVPVVLTSLLHYLETSAQSLDFMRLLIVGSDSWQVQEFRRSSHICAQNTRVINSYGVSEATIDSMFFEGDASKFAPDASVPIGRPFKGTQVYVMDKDLRPVVPGVPGELYIGGPGLAHGYLHNPELTAERFLPDPFSKYPGAKLYRTGDLALWDWEGNVVFLGRADQQVKIRGFRIEVEEIEIVLRRYQTVQDIVVLARKYASSNQKYLAAYIVPCPGMVIDIAELRIFAQQYLPSYMIPRTFTVVDAFPLTSSGKINRHALPEPDQSHLLPSSQFLPATEEEKILAAIWKEVLGVETIGVHDNFFLSGGDSILSMQVVARAIEEGIALTPNDLFEHQTIAELSIAFRKLADRTVEQVPVIGTVPLTPIQCRFFEQELSRPYHWNQAVMLQAQEHLHPAHLQKALSSIILHHDALRLQFTATNAGWEQAYCDAATPVHFFVVDLSGLTSKVQRSAIAQISNQLQASFRFSEGLLIRGALFVSQPDLLFLVAHHLIIDGVSWRILLEDLQTAYQQASSGHEVKLPNKTTSYKSWAECLVAHAQSSSVQQEIGYWLETLSYTHQLLPTDHTWTQRCNTVVSAQAVTVSLSEAETRTLLYDIHTIYHTHINEVLLTALVLALVKWTGSSTLVIDIEGHGREHVFEHIDVSRTIGWFTSVFPCALQLSAEKNLGEVLCSIRDQIRYVPHKGLGYGLLRYISSGNTMAEQLRHLSEAQIRFNYLGQLDQTFLANSPLQLTTHIESGYVSHEDEIRSHLLDLNGMVLNGRFSLSWQYSENIHRIETIQRVANDFLVYLRQIIQHCLSLVETITIAQPEND